MEKPKKILHSLDKYAAIGFDMDHCLVRYKIKDLFPLLYKSMAEVLINEKNYPAEMLEFGKKEKSYIMNGLIIDYETGLTLKLGQEKIILRAYYGYDKVSQTDLENKFGSPPKYESFDPYRLRTKDYMCCLTYFDCCLVAIMAHMIEYKKKLHKENEINIREVILDLSYAEERAYLNWSDTDYTPIATYSAYYRALIEDPGKYAYKQDKLKEMLRSLKAKGKVLFIASNSHYEYVTHMMEFAYGKDWLELFDFVIPNSRKPHFFTRDFPFYEIDESTPNRLGDTVVELKTHGIYSGGNAKTLEENALRLNGEKTGRMLFFGDNYSTDALAAETIDHWDAVCIMEELGDIDFGEHYDDSYWGHWQYEDASEGRIPTFWYDYMSKNVAICTSLVDSIEMTRFYEV